MNNSFLNFSLSEICGPHILLGLRSLIILRYRIHTLNDISIVGLIHPRSSCKLLNLHLLQSWIWHIHRRTAHLVQECSLRQLLEVIDVYLNLAILVDSILLLSLQVHDIAYSKLLLLLHHHVRLVVNAIHKRDLSRDLVTAFGHFLFF